MKGEKPFSPESEKEILEFWQKNKTFEKLVAKNKGKKRWSFLDGPITANNPMGVHHAWGRTLKDLFQRFFAMQGREQRFQNGFDCQGLWVEVEVEKELGMDSKKDIEDYGIAKFIQKCKDRVSKYSKIQTEQSIRLGQWMDWPNSYYTMSDENNYAIWHFLKRCWQKDLLYKGRDSVPWCPRCGTAISQHEILSEEYQELTHKAIFFKLEVLGAENTYFLVWTTTPWTLPGNVALAVHPDFDYVKVKNKQGEIFILLKEKADLIPDGKIIETVKGSKLAGLKYKGLFDEMSQIKKVLDGDEHSVILWKEITQEEGTGIVHIAPGCGREDFQLAQDQDLPVIDLLNGESKYRKGFGDLSGQFVGADKVRDWIFNDLKQKGNVFKIEDYQHRYPTCWRCKSELIFRVVDEWYIKMDPLRKSLMKLTKKISWLPEFGKEMELDWLKNMQDWLISKKRYWGLALPIFECQECDSFEVIGGKEELRKRAVEGFEEFENHSPHRPWVDKVKITCKKCDQKMSRILDVGNPWLDAGIVPYSTMGYFEDKIKDKKFWEKWFPADFICESFPGQFKNWFYSLLAMSCVLENKIPFETVLGHGNVLDEKGEEMHKSKGNAIWFDEAVGKVGADAMRWLYCSTNPFGSLLFGYKAILQAKRKLLMFWNVYNFFATYSKIDNWKFNPKAKKSEHILDRWIESKLQVVAKKVTQNLAKFNSRKATQELENFISDLSLWYLRRSRKRRDDDFYNTLYGVLFDLTKMLAPFLPFSAEALYQDLKTTKDPESVHLTDWPKVDEKLIDTSLDKKMELIRKISRLVHEIRAKNHIKLRQPLSELAIYGDLRGLDKDKELENLILDEVNVEKISFKKPKKIDKDWEVGVVTDERCSFMLNCKITKELKKKGDKRDYIRLIQQARKLAGLNPGQEVLIFLDPEDSILSQSISEVVPDLKNIVKAKQIIQKREKDVDFEKEFLVDGKKIWIGIRK